MAILVAQWQCFKKYTKDHTLYWYIMCKISQDRGYKGKIHKYYIKWYRHEGLKKNTFSVQFYAQLQNKWGIFAKFYQLMPNSVGYMANNIYDHTLLSLQQQVYTNKLDKMALHNLAISRKKILKWWEWI